MSEDMPRLAFYVPFLLKHPDIKIHVASGIVAHAVGLLGISSGRLITGNIKASVLYVPAGSACGRSTFASSYILGLRYREAMSQLPEPRRSIIVQRRRIGYRRWWNNHKQIYSMLTSLAHKYGLEVELFDADHLPSFNKTIAMFNRAVMVVAPHGAGEANLFYSEPGTILVENVCLPMNLCYRNLLATLGQRYIGLWYEHQCMGTKAEEREPFVRKILNTFTRTV
jgi:hypothetical protein